jgi:hypothetical protein
MKIGVETRFEKKQPVETYRLFPQIYTKKSQVWAFGTNLDGFGHSKYLDILAFG